MSSMPLMVDLKRVTVFGGERGEGLQKTQKLALFADELLVVPEVAGATVIDLPAGPQSELKEKLLLPQGRSVPVHGQPASALTDEELRSFVAGRTWVVSDLVDRAINERIAALAAEERVLCTVVDTKDLCNVWFMGLIQTEHLLVGVSSKGTVSFYVPRLREALEPLVAAKESEAAVLAQVRAETPRADRHQVLEDLWSDPGFQARLAARLPQDELLAYARSLNPAPRRDIPFDQGASHGL